MEPLELLRACTGFQWDRGNLTKNWERHRVTPVECEEVFFNEPLIVADDEQHSLAESRYFSLGRTNGGRPLFVVSTIRSKLIRVISARDMSSRERRIYESS